MRATVLKDLKSSVGETKGRCMVYLLCTTGCITDRKAADQIWGGDQISVEGRKVWGRSDQERKRGRETTSGRGG
jgi:hypothetical protein